MTDLNSTLECQRCGTITPWRVLQSGPVEKDNSDNDGPEICPACYGMEFSPYEVRAPEELKYVIRQIEADSRWPGDDAAALVQVNVPLALQQASMEARHSTLKWVLGENESHGGGLEPLEEEK